MANDPTIIPLRHLPLQVTVDGVLVTGEIVALYPNDIEVEIKAPFSGLKSGLHVPHFAMHEANRLATTVGLETYRITGRGREKAESLLRGLYDFARGRKVAWGVDESTPAGWRRAQASTRETS